MNVAFFFEFTEVDISLQCKQHVKYDLEQLWLTLQEWEPQKNKKDNTT